MVSHYCIAMFIEKPPPRKRDQAPASPLPLFLESIEISHYYMTRSE
jgi:hypothetical protein